MFSFVRSPQSSDDSGRLGIPKPSVVTTFVLRPRIPIPSPPVRLRFVYLCVGQDGDRYLPTMGSGEASCCGAESVSRFAVGLGVIHTGDSTHRDPHPPLLFNEEGSWSSLSGVRRVSFGIGNPPFEARHGMGRRTRLESALHRLSASNGWRDRWQS
jgi:hypothetical protein